MYIKTDCKDGKFFSYKKYLILLIICCSTSCSFNSQENKLSIKGNWYSFDKKSKDELGKTFINYTEVYLDENRLFSCIELMGIVSPKNYTISNDSLFIFLKKKELTSFIGVIDTVTENHFSIKTKDTVKFYYKITKGKTLEDYILKKELSEGDYYKEFRNRLNQQLLKNSN